MILIFGSCGNPDVEIVKLKNQTVNLQKQVDSLKGVFKSNDTLQTSNPPVLDSEIKSTASSTKVQGILSPGTRNFTLHWISWDNPGKVTILPAEGGWFSIEGGQENPKNTDYITIKGLIKQISGTELLFKGEIKSVVATNNSGKPCIKTGSKIFKTTQNRQYWRLQDMINCEGGMLTDYIDIYFK